MSSDAPDDEPDDFDLPEVDDDVISTGAAADSSGWDERLKGLPRILRYAMLVGDNADHVRQRLVAEIDELCPDLPLNAAWAPAFDTATGLALAAELDHRAVTQDEPNLRSLADSARMLCLPVPSDASLFEEYRRVGKALLLAFNKAVHHSDDEQLSCDIERFVFGWAALPACTDLLSKNVRAAPNAAILGMRMAEHRIAAAKATVRRQMEQREARRNEREAETEAARLLQEASAEETIPEHHLVVARLSKDEMKNAKLKEVLGPLNLVTARDRLTRLELLTSRGEVRKATYDLALASYDFGAPVPTSSPAPREICTVAEVPSAALAVMVTVCPDANVAGAW